MQKTRLYFDTSAICKIFNPRELAEKEIDTTIAMFDFIEQHREEYDLVISPIFASEINNCPDWLLQQVSDFIEKNVFSVVDENREADILAKKYVDGGVLSARHFSDLTHIAYATIYNCDFIISWNFKHFVNVRTIERVKNINNANNYKSALIISPFTFEEIKND
jgi:hypothetical protein